MATEKQPEDFEAWKGRIQKVISDVEHETNPATQSLRQMERDNLERVIKERKEIQRKAWYQILYFLIVVALIPVLVWLWNIHPVLGILGIIGYIWIIRNKIQNGYYLSW